MSSSWRRSLSVWGLLIGLALLAIVLSQVSLAESLRTVAKLDSTRLALPALVTAALVALRAARWQAIFQSSLRPGFGTCFWALAVGNLANTILPGRAGDVLRCFLVRRGPQPTGASVALATVGLEKLLDGLSLLSLLAVFFWFSGAPAWLGRLAVVAGLVFLAILALFVLLRMRTHWFLAVVTRFASVFPARGATTRLTESLVQFSKGLSAVTDPRQAVGLVALTLLTWGSETLLIWTLAKALHLELALSGSVLVCAILGLGLAIPGAPGFVGTYEFFSVAALRLSAVGPEDALALTLVMHTWSLISTIIVGLVGLAATGLTWSQLARPRVHQHTVS